MKYKTLFMIILEISSTLYVSIKRKISIKILCTGLKYPILKKLFENCLMVDITISKFLLILLQKGFICSFIFFFIFFCFIIFIY